MPRFRATRTDGARLNSAELCRSNGWDVGTQLVGDEGYGPTVIEITAIGEEHIFAKTLSHAGKPSPFGEQNWTLEYRDWQRCDTGGEK